MFNKIAVPVDLAHTDSLSNALDTAADLAKHYGAHVTNIDVSSSAPGALGHTPEEYAENLTAFARSQGESNGAGIDADLGVMVMHHIPNVADHIWPSHGG